MVKKALLIGIDYINDPVVQRNNCIQNMIHMKQMLMNAYGYQEKEMVVLRDDSADTTFLPTKNNIVNGLSELARESADLEEIWFYFTGCSSQMADQTGEEIDGLEELIVPCDFRLNGMIEDDCIFQIIRSVKCRLILVFDCSHSGTICNLQWNIDYVDGLFVKTMNPNKYTANESIVCFSACKDEQLIDSDSDNTTTPMNFTATFLDSLSSLDYNTDVLELFSKIRRHYTSANQTPQLSCSNITPDFKLLKNSICTTDSTVQRFKLRKYIGIDAPVVEPVEEFVVESYVQPITEPVIIPPVVVREVPVPKIRSPMAFTQTPSTIPLYYQKLSVISKNNTNPLYHISIKKR